MEQGTQNPKRGRQLRVLVILTLLLFAIVISPLLRIGVQELLPRAPIGLGVAQLSIPPTWMVSRDPMRVSVWKSCATIFCHSADSSFVIEVKYLPDDVWQRAARQILQDNYSAKAANISINGDSGPWKCLEATLADGRVVASCTNSDLRLTSTFTGKPSLKPAFYLVLAKAHKGT